MTQYFLFNKNSNVQFSTTVLSDPHLQRFNVNDNNPLPFIYCCDLSNPSFTSEILSISDVYCIWASLKEMIYLVVFNVKHSWRVFRYSLNKNNELWIYNLWGRKPLELSKRRNRGMTFKSHWITDVKLDLEDAVTYVNFIMAYPSYIPGIPLLSFFNNNLLLTVLTSSEQACTICFLAIIAMGELITFINHWRVTVGSNWASNFSSAMQAFICWIQLTHLLMRGGVYNAGDRVHGFFIWCSIKSEAPTYLLNTRSPAECKHLL